MLRELLAIFRSDNPLARMGRQFAEMLDLAHDLTVRAGAVLFDDAGGPNERTAISKRDVKVNKLERKIRKQVIAHLALGNAGDVPYCLLLMSLVKDVERLGDYAKNVAEIYDDGGGPLPDDDNAAELQSIRDVVESTFGAVKDVFTSSDFETAVDLAREGRDVSRRCDALITRIARSSYDAPTTTSMILATRYYKRIGGHLLNILSGVVMPLHKLDYYDEKRLGPPVGSRGKSPNQ